MRVTLGLALLLLAGCVTGLPTQALHGQPADRIAADQRACDAAARSYANVTGPEMLVRPSPRLTRYASCLLARGYEVDVPMTVTTNFGLGNRVPDITMQIRADQPIEEMVAAAALMICRDEARAAALVRIASASPETDLGRQAVGLFGLGLANQNWYEDQRALIACLGARGLTAK